MTNRNRLLPINELTDLPVPEFAYIVLEYLQSAGDSAIYEPRSYIAHLVERHGANPIRVARPVMEAFNWLEHHGLLCHSSRDAGMWITRKGEEALRLGGAKQFRLSVLIPKELMHPTIAEATHADLVRGEHESAVFRAFKQVEIAVRSAGGFPQEMVGVDLMRQAFKASTGPLTDPSVIVPEQEATGHLFAGAMGYAKNPTSHRNVSIDVEEAIELIMLASHLLRIVDASAERLAKVKQ